MATNTSSKYDSITCKVLIQSGSPAVYQLTPKKENSGPLSRMTLGEKNPNKINKTILLVGETGTGKSTLINALVNYALGVKWEDNIWFKIVEEKEKSQSKSQKSNVTVYQIFGFEGQTLPFSLTIIDTPGYGDTRGTEYDNIVSEKLFDLFRSEDGVHEINAVGLVLKATENRLSDRLRYIFDSAVSLFGKDMEKNIVALITHSDGRTPKNALKALEAANIKCARNAKNQPVHFLFDNCQNEDRTEDEEELEHSDKITMKGMSQFKEFLVKTEPQKLDTTLDVLNERKRLTACIESLQERIKFIEDQQNEIQKNHALLKKYEEKMKKNENFIEEDEEVYKERKPIRQRATSCKVCEENCHYPCDCGWIFIGSSPSSCEKMKGGHCSICTRKCSVTDHVKENWIYVNKTRPIQKTLKNVMEKYEKNEAESEDKLSLLENLQKTTDKLTAEKDQMLDESFQHVVRLEQIALNVNSLSTYVHLDFLIEKMKEKGDTEKVQKLEEMKSRVDEGTKAGLQYMFDKRPDAGKAAGEAVK